jgi:hypothetical protein
MERSMARAAHLTRVSDLNQAPDHDQTQKAAQLVIEEGRMVLPGIQALFGFQLVAVFNARFTELSRVDQDLHFFAMLLVALATALIMTPAAYHRQAERGTASTFFVNLASNLITTAMVPLMFGLSLDVYILGQLIFSDTLAAAAFAFALLCVFAGLWFVFPWLAVRWRLSEGGRG